ncbi:hypothetical protein GCM10011409_34930 [Lentibacillus populi]|uniref:Uncharacterized protein n=1 Tax=Lentibacillus populi TaxID=1827502 RepID=A0A9W5X6S4_9BACI|nr:hypothetical protein [Lentibacillus populi]GGB54324.1 hypothetical protein GCM10011409_34930 [Lentibacillus populi]
MVASTGVTSYLTKNAITATLRQVAMFSPGSMLAITFLLPLELAEPEERPEVEAAEKGARVSGTPFISFFRPPEILALARKAGSEQSGMYPRPILTNDILPDEPMVLDCRAERSFW